MQASAILFRPRQASTRVLFTEDFDVEPAPPPCTEVPPSEPEVIEPSFTFADLDAARADGFAEGMAQAHLEAEMAERNEVQLARAQLCQALAAAEAEATRIAEAAAAALAELLVGAAMAALPISCERHGPAEAAAVTAALLPALADEPYVNVNAAPSAAASIRHVISGLEPSVQQRIALSENDTMSPGDVTIAWREGRAVRDTAAMLAAIDRALRSCLPSFPASAEHHDAG